jgi:mRNA-degrading endonuclease toxin of MazEF toxin-antitoxin module
MMAPPAQWYPHRGEVYLASGLDKKRPVVVISADFLNRQALDVTVIPITSVERLKFSCRVPIAAGVAGLRRNSFAKCDGVVTVNKSSILFPPLGTLPADVMTNIEQALKDALDLP